MKLPKRALELLKKHEGLRLHAYPDAGYGWSRATIGYGHTSAAGPPRVTKGMVITRAEAEDILRRDAEKFLDDIMRYIKVPVNGNQKAALLSLAFNIGQGAFRKSRLLAELNKGNYNRASQLFAPWRKSNGRVLKGLVRRRAEEAALFLQPVANVDPEVHADLPAEVEIDRKAPWESTTQWSNIISQLFGQIGVFFAFAEKQPWLAAAMMIGLAAVGLWIMRERSRKGDFGI